MRTVRRTQVPLLGERFNAILSCPLVHHLGAAIPEKEVGNPRIHPLAAHLAYAALARVWRSGARVDGELPGLWPGFVDAFNIGAHTAGTETLTDDSPPITWHNFRRARDHMTTDPALEILRTAFSAQSMRIARQLGLLDPKGPGSLTHPHLSRTIYGDGTVVRPMYRTRNELDPAEQDDARPRRHDPDAAVHVRHDGRIAGRNFVAFHARTDQRFGRVVLGIDQVPAPGQEAATAVKVVRELHALAGGGIQCVVYDGAWTGAAIERIMSECGLVVVNKVAAAPTPGGLKAKGVKLAKQYPVGVFTHEPNGTRCDHTVISHGGGLTETTLDDAGDLHVTEPLRRVQLKRFRRTGGGYRFSIGAEVNCPRGPFTIWVSPHPQRGDTTYRRPENIRLISETDDDFRRIYAVRNDAESHHSGWKATLLVDRAMSLGWRRQLLDYLAYGILTNTHAWATSVAASHLSLAA